MTDQEPKVSGSVNPAKKTYATPHLVPYGDIRQLTLTTATAGTVADNVFHMNRTG